MRFDGFRASFGSDFYFDKETIGSEQKLSKEQYQKFVAEVSDIIRALSEKLGDVETQRAIVQAKTIDNLRNFKNKIIF